MKSRKTQRWPTVCLVGIPLLTAAAVLWLGLRPEPAPAAGADLLLITIDTLRADRIGVGGDTRAQTAVMDALAARGTRFEQATTPLPRTTPAVASLMTGLWPHHHGSREVYKPIRNGTTLAEVLRDHGYRTLAVSASGALSDTQHLDRGFDDILLHRELREYTTSRATPVTDAALALLDEAGPSEEEDVPVFLWVHYFDPHYPYDPPPDFPQPEAERCRELRQHKGARRGIVFGNRDGIAERALEDCEALYAAEISYLDGEIGRLLSGVAERRSRPSLVVLTSDHGENLGEEGLYYQHGPSLSDASLRVPLIFAGPGIPQGRVDRGPARLEDIAPTLFSLLGVPESERPEADGVNLSQRFRLRPRERADVDVVAYAESGGALMIDLHRLAVISGRPRTGYCVNDSRFSLCWKGEETPRLYDRHRDPDREHDVASEHPETYARLLRARATWQGDHPRQRSVRDGLYKLVERPLLEGGYSRSLYNLETDPRETRDVSAAHPETAQRLGALLDAWARELPSYVQRPLDAREEEALRALGYID